MGDTTVARASWRKHSAVRAKVRELVGKMPEATAAEIYDKIPDEMFDENHWPTQRTVERWVNTERPRGPEWVGSKATPEEFRRVAPVIWWMRKNTRRLWITYAEAEKVVWISGIAPSLSLGKVSALSRLYVVYEQQKLSTRELDEVLIKYVSEGPVKDASEGPGGAFEVGQGNRRGQMSRAKLSELANDSTGFAAFEPTRETGGTAR